MWPGKKSGLCGRDLKWKLNSDGILIIYGNGSMDDYKPENYSEDQADKKSFPPWSQYASRIAVLVLLPGACSIGSCAFDAWNLPAGGTVNWRRPGEAGTGKEGERRKYCQLHTVVLPDTVTRIGENAFRGCTQLESVSFSARLKTIGSGAFAGCSRLQTVHLPESLRKIGNGAFQDCIELCDPDLPEGLQYIGASAFEGCLMLRDIYIPESVSFIGEEAFSGCSFLKEVSFAGKPPEAGGAPFDEVSTRAEYFADFAEFWTDEEKVKWGRSLRWKMLRLPSSADELEAICTEAQEIQAEQNIEESTAAESPETPKHGEVIYIHTQYCAETDDTSLWIEEPGEEGPVWRRRIREAAYWLFVLSIFGEIVSLALVPGSFMLKILYPSLLLLCLSFAVWTILEE